MLQRRKILDSLIEGLKTGDKAYLDALIYHLENEYEPDHPERITVERALVKQYGLYAFVRLAWHLVEPEFPFVDNWHIPLMCRKLEQVTAQEIRKIVFNIPPGCMKSLLVSTFWPAWEWIEKPGTRWLFGSYAQDVANKNAKMHRDIVASKWYSDRWPLVTLDKIATKKIQTFENNFKGVRYTRGIEAQTTGVHAHRIVYDDLLDAKDARGRAAIGMDKIERANDWWFKSAISRQANPKLTTYVGIMQRMHFHDTSALCIERGYEVFALQMHYDPEWEHNLPEDPRTEKGELLWPDRYDHEALDTIKEGLTDLLYEAQYQQNPAPSQGALFKEEHFTNRWDPETLDYSYVIITVDCTFKDLDSSDYVAIQAWARVGKKIALLDRWMGKWDIFKTVAACKRARNHYPSATIHVEDKANGPAVVKILKRDLGMIKEWSPGRTSKGERASAAAFVFECGDVLFPPDEIAPWFSKYKQQLTRFPVDKHDDDVDATSMAVIILTEKGLSILDVL